VKAARSGQWCFGWYGWPSGGWDRGLCLSVPFGTSDEHANRAPQIQRRCQSVFVETVVMLVHQILSRNFLPHAPAKKQRAFLQSERVKSTGMTIGELYPRDRAGLTAPAGHETSAS
jgi:hypothetical protein